MTFGPLLACLGSGARRSAGSLQVTDGIWRLARARGLDGAAADLGHRRVRPAFLGISPVLVFPGTALTMLRCYMEHRPAKDPGARCAIVEDAGPFGFLFLHNNLHAVHHRWPGVAWYRLPALYRARRDDILAWNGGYLISGYGAILRHFLCGLRTTRFIRTIVRRRSALAMRASLPMSDLPNLRAATDRWWLGVAQAVARRGFAPVPPGLDRSDPPGSVWRRRDLVLSESVRARSGHAPGRAGLTGGNTQLPGGGLLGRHLSLVARRQARRCPPEARRLRRRHGGGELYRLPFGLGGAGACPGPRRAARALLWPCCLHGRSSRLAAGGR